MATDIEIAENLAILLAGFDIHFQNPEQTIQAYVDSLRDVEDHLLREACKRALMRSKFFPRIAELLAIVQEVDDELKTRTDLKPGALMKRFCELYDAWFADGSLDTASWKRLESDYLLAGRQAMAETVKHKREFFEDLRRINERAMQNGLGDVREGRGA